MCFDLCSAMAKTLREEMGRREMRKGIKQGKVGEEGEE